MTKAGSELSCCECRTRRRITES